MAISKSKVNLITSASRWEPSTCLKYVTGTLMVLGIMVMLAGGIMVAVSLVEHEQEKRQLYYRYLGFVLMGVSPLLIACSFGLFHTARGYERRYRKRDYIQRLTYALGYNPCEYHNKKGKKKGRVPERHRWQGDSPAQHPLLGKRNDQIYPHQQQQEGFELQEPKEGQLWQRRQQPGTENTTEQHEEHYGREQQLQRFLDQEEEMHKEKLLLQQKQQQNLRTAIDTDTAATAVVKDSPRTHKRMQSQSGSSFISMSRSEAIRVLQERGISKPVKTKEIEIVPLETRDTSFSTKTSTPSQQRKSQQNIQKGDSKTAEVESSMTYVSKPESPKGTATSTVQDLKSQPNHSTPNSNSDNPPSVISQIEETPDIKKPTTPPLSPEPKRRQGSWRESYPKDKLNNNELVCTCDHKKKNKNASNESQGSPRSHPKNSNVCSQRPKNTEVSPQRTAFKPPEIRGYISPPRDNEYQVYSLYSVVPATEGALITHTPSYSSVLNSPYYGIPAEGERDDNSSDQTEEKMDGHVIRTTAQLHPIPDTGNKSSSSTEETKIELSHTRPQSYPPKIYSDNGYTGEIKFDMFNIPQTTIPLREFELSLKTAKTSPNNKPSSSRKSSRKLLSHPKDMLYPRSGDYDEPSTLNNHSERVNANDFNGNHGNTTMLTNWLKLSQKKQMEDVISALSADERDAGYSSGPQRPENCTSPISVCSETDEGSRLQNVDFGINLHVAENSPNYPDYSDILRGSYPTHYYDVISTDENQEEEIGDVRRRTRRSRPLSWQRPVSHHSETNKSESSALISLRHSGSSFTSVTESNLSDLSRSVSSTCTPRSSVMMSDDDILDITTDDERVADV